MTTITNATERSSTDVMKLFRQKISTHPSLFTLDDADASPSLVFMEDCMPREKANEAYSCFYTAHYAGGMTKTLLGAGIYASKSADDMADNLLSAVAQDIAERWNDIAKSNAIETLEACLFLTQSSCAVPEVLVPELKSKVLNLSQYLQKGGLKK